MLEHEREDGGTEEADDGRRRGRDVRRLRAGWLGDRLRWHGDRLGRVLVGDRDPLLRRATDHLGVDLRDERVRRELGQRVAHRVDAVPLDRHHRLLAVAQLLRGVLGRDDEEADLLAGEAPAGLVDILDDVDHVQLSVADLAVVLDVGREVRLGRNDDERVERRSRPGVADAKEGHDQKRPENEAEDDARAPDELADLLEDERRDADDALAERPHATCSSSPACRRSARRRSTSSAKTSSKLG